MLTKELKKRWVDALRSGKYTQANTYLKSDKGLCCLGVLCEIQDSKAWRDSNIPHHVEKGVQSHNDDYSGNESDPTVALQRLTYNQREQLVNMNDEEHKDFIEIADYIEEYIEST